MPRSKECLERRREYVRNRYKNDPQKYIDYARQYRKTEKGKKVDTMSRWRNQHGMIDITDELYDKYIAQTHCELCNVLFDNKVGNSNQSKCLDHHHMTGYPRFICCQLCNKKIPIIERNHLQVLLELHRYFNTRQL